ncbi:sensor histidine kinase [Enterococcus sp. HY326]|uniref:sensor histidine kinase n=1 Tax=Enterococcus sp. HY326 TaxID=2971265 RepID=UPI00223FF23B|nr:HAMP domain-containing sensor histidine kinase [Enterococcus sp. HY326]
MRYLYQQLLAFWSVIIIVMLIIGFSFTQLTRNTMEQNNYQQLFSYSSSAFNLAKNNSQLQFNQVLDSASNLFSPQGVTFAIFGTDGSLSYVSATENAESSVEESSVLITSSEWAQLSDDNNTQMITKTLSTDLYGKTETTSYVFRSMYNGSTGEFLGVLVTSQPARNLQQSIQAINSNLIKGFIVSLFIALIMSYYFARFQVKKINRLKQATKQISEGNFDVEIPNHNKDEFDELAQDFNKMAGSLKESNEEIERQEERRKQFMADASHEMRTPLTTIKGLLEGLEYNAIPENQKENAIHLMQTETERLIRLVTENLDYEKIRTNQLSIVIKKFDATETMAKILNQLESKAQASNDKLELLTTDAVDVFADYDRFTQIMVNILQNAIQFTNDGTISVAVDKGYLETIVSITDTGIGMDEAQRKNIWERYYKADPSRTSTKYGESGLGLSIVQQLVKLHKGSIEVESEAGKGTTFRISFPDIELADGEEKPQLPEESSK